jgi:hypothetical protein
MSGLLRFILGGDVFVRWRGSTSFGLSLSKSSLDTGAALSTASGAALSPRQATYCSFASPKESRQRKGDPGVCVPFASLRGNLRCSDQPGSRSNSPAAQTIAGPFPSSPALLGAFTRVLQEGSGSDSGMGSDQSGLYIAIIFIAAHARITWARGPKHIRSWRAAWFWRSDRNFSAKHPQGAPKARQIWALTPKTPESASASFPEFNPQTPCGRAEQRRLGRIKILDVRRLRSRLVSKISAPAEQRKEPRRGPDFGSPFFSLGFFGEAKKSRSPAAATERHRNPSTNLRPDLKQGFDRLNPNGFPKIPKSPTPC